MSDEQQATPAAEPAADAGTELDEQTATDVANLRALTEEIADKQAQQKEIRARLREHWQPGRRYTFGGRDVLSIGAPGQQFDADLAASVVPPGLLAQITVTKPDAATAKRILPADLYAKCCKAKAAAVEAL